MTSTSKGRFCDSCCKEVIDFTLMTDQQILDHISRSRNNICGRLASDQLNRDLIRSRDRRTGWLHYIIQLALPALLMTSRLAAQSTHKPDTITSSDHHLKKKIAKAAVATLSAGPIETKLIAPDIKVQGSSVISQVAATPMLVGIAGGVTVCRRRTIPAIVKIKDSLTTIFSADSIKLYPNPVARGEAVRIEFDLKNPARLLIEIFNLSGQKLFQKNIEPNSKKFIDQFSSDFARVSGLYVVKVTNLNSKKQISRKLVVQ